MQEPCISDCRTFFGVGLALCTAVEIKAFAKISSEKVLTEILD